VKKIKPLPCPFCGTRPTLDPERPDLEGSAWGRVRCVSIRCPANPQVDDGIEIADERGSDAYKQAAIRRWNKRASM
jgi:hypothetical protein